MLKNLLFFILLSCVTAPVMATVSYVSFAATGSNDGTSWSNAYTTLSTALIAANINTAIDSILVAQGVYYPTGAQNGTDQDSAFIIYRGGLKVYGGYNATTGIRDIIANPTYMDGNIGTAGINTDNSYHVMVIAGLTATADSVVVDGFTIRNGDANGFAGFSYNGQFMPEDNGGGLFQSGNANGGATVIRNCTFSANYEDQDGVLSTGTFGGAGMYNNHASPFIANCTFSGNNAVAGAGNGGAIYNHFSSPVITNCVFTGNLANWGSGIYDTASAPIITNCTFTGNIAVTASNGFVFGAGQGGGIFEDGASNAVISNCIFSANTCPGGGGAFVSGVNGNSINTTIKHCVFINDTASYGAAILMEGFTNLSAFDNVFYKNISDTGGGGAITFSNTGTDSLFNNVFAKNEDVTAGSGQGGAIQTNDATTYIVNNTFYANAAVNGIGGAIRYIAGTNYLYNNIFYANIANVSVDVYGVATFSGNNIYSATNPFFVNTANLIGPDNIWGTADDGLILTPCSPAINTGSNNENTTTTDIANQPRVFGSIIDLGAYEFQGLPGVASDTIFHTTICAGDSALFNGAYYHTTGFYTDTFHIATGCDSIISLNLVVNPALTATQNITICASQLPYSWNGNLITAGGTSAATFSTPSFVTSCDSITTLNLTVNPVLTATQNLTICAGQLPYSWNGNTITSGGAGADTFTAASLVTGCDSSTILNLTVNPVPTVTQSLTLCVTQLPYSWNGFNVAADGTAAATFTTPSLITGCDSITTLDLTITSAGGFNLNLSMNPANPYTDQAIVFTVSNTGDSNDYNVYSWTPATWFSDQTAQSQTIIATTGGTVIVTGQNKDGCVDSASITFDVTPLQYGVFVPSAFTPNGDNKNDVFEARFFITAGYTIGAFNIYNRWGQLVYSGAGNNAAWNGNYTNGIKADVGTYSYLISATFIDGHIEVLKGNVELIR